MIVYYGRLDRARRAVARDCTPAGPVEGKGLWICDKPVKPPKSYDYATAIAASKILIVANAKGGVGKTTVCANLGAYFSQQFTRPVLMIDLDFQGSLSSMSIVGQENWLPPQNLDSEATYLISGDRSTNHVASVGRHATGAESLKIIGSYYDLAQAENRTMVEWLIGDHKSDLRFRLAEILHSIAVRETYSLVLIDCPPRLTTAAIQALAAATHVLIPTRLEEPSTEAVTTFVNQVETFREAGLCRYINHVGVVATMVDARANTEGIKGRLRDALSGGATELLDCEIPQSTKFRESEGITYLNGQCAECTAAEDGDRGSRRRRTESDEPMKGKEFADLLNELSVFLRSVEAREAAEGLSTLARVFSSAPRREVGDVCSVLSGVEPPEHNNGPRTREMLPLFVALRRFLKRAKVNKRTELDLDKFEDALRIQEQASPEGVTDAAIKKLREQAVGAKAQPLRQLSAEAAAWVDQYVNRLETTLGDGDKFKAVFEELKADGAIRRDEAIALAKQFAKETAKSRDNALKLIMARHTALLGSRARQKANKGRTAA